MAKTKVKCPYCNEIFIREETPFVKLGRRYAHKSCYEANYNPDEEYISKIYELVKTIYGPNYDFTSIERQRKSFVKKGFSNQDIFESLKYYYEVLGNSTEGSGGRIGIVPYVKDTAVAYYKRQAEYAARLSQSAPTTEKIMDFSGLSERNAKKDYIPKHFIDLKDLE